MFTRKHLACISVFLALFSFIFCGCGDKGADGKAYVSLTWYTSTDEIGGFSQLPTYITNGQSYPVSPGYFSGWYTTTTGYFYTVGLTISINVGEDGGLFTDGDPGADKYYKIYLYSNGPDYSKAPANLVTNSTDIKKYLSGDDLKSSQDGGAKELIKSTLQQPKNVSEYDTSVALSTFTIEDQQGNYYFRVQYTCYGKK